MNPKSKNRNLPQPSKARDFYVAIPHHLSSPRLITSFSLFPERLATSSSLQASHSRPSNCLIDKNNYIEPRVIAPDLPLLGRSSFHSQPRNGRVCQQACPPPPWCICQPGKRWELFLQTTLHWLPKAGSQAAFCRPFAMNKCTLLKNSLIVTWSERRQMKISVWLHSAG